MKKVKLTHYHKSFIKQSVHELGINNLKFIAEDDGMQLVNRLIKIVRYIQKKEKLILLYLYSNCTTSASNYYNWSHEKLLSMGFISKDGFYYKYNLDTFH